MARDRAAGFRTGSALPARYRTALQALATVSPVATRLITQPVPLVESEQADVMSFTDWKRTCELRAMASARACWRPVTNSVVTLRMRVFVNQAEKAGTA